MRAVLMADRITALGFRLAGVRVIDARHEEVPDRFREALEGADLVLLSAQVARALPYGQLRAAMERGDPPVQILPTIPSVEPDTRIGRQCRRALGVGA